MGLVRWFCQLFDRIENNIKLLVVVLEFGFDLIQLFLDAPVCRQDFPESDKGPHDGDIDLDGPWTIEDAGEHGNALLCEDQGGLSPPAVSFGV